MGLLGKDDEEESRGSVDEVTISAAEPEKETEVDESDLRNEVESKFSSRSKASKTSKKSSSSVSLEDVHRQNEKIISMLEELTDEPEEEDNGNDFVGGDMNGVL